MVPVASGYCTSAPKKVVSNSNVSGLPTINSIPRFLARPSTTSMVCKKAVSAIKNLFFPSFTSFREREFQNIIIASAAEVASSNKDAFAISIPVNSKTIVWKFNNASNRP